jgi:hypothetical protein
VRLPSDPERRALVILTLGFLGTGVAILAPGGELLFLLGALAIGMVPDPSDPS